ncbi:MAG: CDP-alcohol phosphatidyltransferase family protein [Nannocystis sp.]|uniref:CDP-alcohol phosphatidyltransferase family protein n=1 Tax=Nannocystis sp. TaxID=1962667 RepID=UPI0024210603|nr:CDP-alcohol phosphatidyltransferase family protein [Nannocystis sp.]MBK9757261.1 CDP-alcohol phosphatidyltransferase family protein [Nannocystis sp.]
MTASFSDLADRLTSDPVFVVTGPEGGYALRVGGVTVLERILWGLAREGVRSVSVAAPQMTLRPDLPVLVHWVAPASAPPDGTRLVRGDEIEGIRVVDEASRRAAEWTVCWLLSKSHKGLVDRFNVRLSIPVARLLSYTPIRPNHVTFVSAMFGVAAAWSVLGGTPAALALGAVFLQIQSLLDGCDGQLARLRFQMSVFGQWFDNVADDVIDILFIVCLGVALGGGYATLAIASGVLRAFGQIVLYHEVYRRTGTGNVFAFRIWFQADRPSVDEVFAPRDLGTYLRALGRRDTYVFVWMVLCLLGQIEVVVVYGAVLGSIIGVLMALHLALRRSLPSRA